MTYSDIKAKVYQLTKTNSSSFPVADLTIYANNALERVVSLILHSDGRWQFDDTNQTDLPIATTSLVADQQDYSIDVAHLEVTKVELKDSNGGWHLLSPIDQADINSQAMTEFQSTSGVPQYYDKIANSVFLYPKPNYSQSASLKVYFKRAPSLFVVGDTTKTPGFQSIYHELIPLWVSYEYMVANGTKGAEQVYRTIKDMEDSLVESYSLRGKDEHISIRPRYHNFR